MFELTIRVLGGLLSAYALTGSNDTMLLSKAVELADILLPAFATPSKIPLSSIDFATKKAVGADGGRGFSSTAEATTVQMEFKYLAIVTGEEKYWNVVQEAEGVVLREAEGRGEKGLVPIFVDVETGKFAGEVVRLGSRGDSYYGGFYSSSFHLRLFPSFSPLCSLVLCRSDHWGGMRFEVRLAMKCQLGQMTLVLRVDPAKVRVLGDG